MSPFFRQFRAFPLHAAGTVVLVAIAGLAGLTMFAVGAAFQANWAVGWPGISHHVVFSSYLTLSTFVMLTLGCALILAFPCALLERFVRRNYIGWATFAAALFACAVGNAVYCRFAYAAFLREVQVNWP